MAELHLTVSNLMSYSEAARHLGVSRQTVYAMIERGELRPFAIAERRYLMTVEVEQLRRDRLSKEGDGKKSRRTPTVAQPGSQGKPGVSDGGTSGL